ncbi:MAG: hypothetical protein VX346_17995 [Planctomycetota bacterium]|nr:hypothetical protein [Planctomycetota bacterium]
MTRNRKCLWLVIWCCVTPSLVGAEPISLRAGPLSMLFDTDHAMLRFLRVGPVEVLRGINAPVRNQYWGTLPTKVTNVRLRNEGRQFSLRFDVACVEREIDFSWSGTVIGTAEGVVTFRFRGRANSSFLRNRIGFCVLHPASAAGKPWQIETTDGKRSKGQFPQWISPQQPAKNLRAITHQIAPEVWAEVRCQGETFEMEDQRNWTDGSFKTYCTPLEKPYPVKIDEGTVIEQSVEVRLTGPVEKLASSQPDRENAVTLTVVEGAEEQRRLPPIGMQVSSQVSELSELEAVRLRPLQLDHLRIRIDTGGEDVETQLAAASEQAELLGVSLHVALNIGDEAVAELRRLSSVVARVKPPVASWFVTEATTERFELVRELLGNQRQIGVAEDTNFTELNRNRPASAAMRLVSFGLNPQCHASDNLTLIETLEIQGEAVRSARQFVGDRRLFVSPVTLKVQKVNQPPLPGELPSNVDLRQASLFGACWTLGSIKYLAEAGVDGVTYYETIGWKGVMSPGRGVRVPRVFPVLPSRVYPVYHVLRLVGEFVGGQVRPVSSTATMEVVGMALEHRRRRRLLIANLSSRRQTVRVVGARAAPATLFRLNRGNVAAASIDPEAFVQRAGESLKVEAGMTVKMAPYELIAIDQ